MNRNNHYNILIIEDNLGDLLLIKEYLIEQNLDVHITHCDNFKDASSCLTDTKYTFDVILLDVSLPDKSGESLIVDIIALSDGCPVVILTGYADIEFSIKSLAVGASDYLLKDDINATSLYKSIIYTIERRKASKALQDSEKKYTELFHLSPEPMWVFDRATLQFHDVNLAAIQHYGYSAAEFSLMNLKDIFLAEERSTLDNVLNSIEEKSGNHSFGKFKNQTKNGTIIEVELFGCFIEFNGRKAEVIVIHDVTKMVEYIRAIEDQNNKLREIAWIQSHRTRAPLANIMGIAKLLREIPLDELDKTELLANLLDSAKELDEVVQNITHKTHQAKFPVQRESK